MNKAVVLLILGSSLAALGQANTDYSGCGPYIEGDVTSYGPQTIGIGSPTITTSLQCLCNAGGTFPAMSEL
jgi:hypothetical protein